MAIVYDPTTKRIILDSATVTATELYSRSCDWLATGDNSKYGAIFRQVGGDDLGGGVSIPPYFFLQGAWRVRPMEADHDLNFEGNLFVEGGGNPFVRTLGPYQVNVRSTVPVQAQVVSTSGANYTVQDIATAVRTELTPELTSISAMQIKVDLATAILKNKTITDPTTGVMTIYATDGVTPLLSTQLYENVAGTQTYRGQGAERREALV